MFFLAQEIASLNSSPIHKLFKDLIIFHTKQSPWHTLKSRLSYPSIPPKKHLANLSPSISSDHFHCANHPSGLHCFQVEPCGATVCDGLGPVDCLWDPWGEWYANLQEMWSLGNCLETQKIRKKKTFKKSENYHLRTTHIGLLVFFGWKKSTLDVFLAPSCSAVILCFLKMRIDGSTILHSRSSCIFEFRI